MSMKVSRKQEDVLGSGSDAITSLEQSNTRLKKFRCVFCEKDSPRSGYLTNTNSKNYALQCRCLNCFLPVVRISLKQKVSDLAHFRSNKYGIWCVPV